MAKPNINKCLLPGENALLDFYLKHINCPDYLICCDNGIETADKFSDGNFYWSTSGHADGCVTKAELAKNIINRATHDELVNSGTLLSEKFFNTFKMHIPFLLRKECRIGSLETNLSKELIEIESLEERVKNKFNELNSPEAKYELALEISDLVKAKTFNSENNIWHLYSYFKLAGLQVNFVKVEQDVIGQNLAQHVALMLDLGGRTTPIVIDPAYGDFDIEHKNVQMISELEALGYYALQEAVKAKDPRGYLEFASIALPLNIDVLMFKLMLGDSDKSLNIFEGVDSFQIESARRILQGAK